MTDDDIKGERQRLEGGGAKTVQPPTHKYYVSRLMYSCFMITNEHNIINYCHALKYKKPHPKRAWPD